MPQRSHSLTRKLWRYAWIYALLILFAITTLAPLAWGISTSLKPPADVFAYPPQWIPETIRWSNYADAWNLAPFGRYYFNSIYITVLIVIGHIITSSMGGFAFSRLHFPGRDTIFLIYLASMLIPGTVIMIPVFLVVKTLGWADSHLSLIVPSLATPFGTFLFRQFFLSVPEDLADAARIDGCTPFGIYRRIFMPLARPATATLAIFTAMGVWNSFLWPLILINSPEKYTVTLGLGLLRGSGQFHVAWEIVMAGTATALIPIIILFLFFQRYFVEGVTLSGVKG